VSIYSLDKQIQGVAMATPCFARIYHAMEYCIRYSLPNEDVAFAEYIIEIGQLSFGVYRIYKE